MDWYLHISVGPGPSHYDRLATAGAAHNLLTLGTREYSAAVAVVCINSSGGGLYQQQWRWSVSTAATTNNSHHVTYDL